MDGELLSLKWNNHRVTFYHVISGLRNKDTYTDVTLACEGKFYPAHKFVLSTCSEYFNEIFDFTSCKNPVIVLKDINHKDLEFLLDYMYIGEVNVRQNELSSLIKAAECLRVKGLAVPDEDTKDSGSASTNSMSQSNSSRQRPEQSSPPAKRRRAEERRGAPLVTDQSPGRPPGDSALNSPSNSNLSVLDTNKVIDQPDQYDTETIVIKEEKEDTDTLMSVQNNFDSGENDGDGIHDSESNSVGEFLQSTIEKEEPVEFNPDFPGPSGLQNNTLAPWESENTSSNFSEGLTGAVAAAVAAVSQPQQRQQQQLGRKTKYTCIECGRVSNCLSKFRQHWMIHSGEKPFKCSVCPYSCIKKNDLQKHMDRHTGYKRFKCNYCSYSSPRRNYVKLHVGTKHGHEYLNENYYKDLEASPAESPDPYAASFLESVTADSPPPE